MEACSGAGAEGTIRLAGPKRVWGLHPSSEEGAGAGACVVGGGPLCLGAAASGQGCAHAPTP